MVHFWRVFHRWLPGDPFSEGKPPVIFIVHFESIILFLRRRHFKRDVTGFKIGQLKNFEGKKTLGFLKHSVTSIQKAEVLP